MKRLASHLIIIGLSLLLALLSAALTYYSPSGEEMNFSGHTFFMQVTPTPQPEDRSEVGSTDEITIMSGVISLIIVVPILLRRKNWR